MRIEKSGEYATVYLLEEVTLTADFADNVSEGVALSPFTQMEMFIDYTMAAGESGNSVVVKVEVQDESTGEWRELSISADAAPSGGVVLSTLYPRRYKISAAAAEAPERRWFAIPTSARFLRVAAMEDGLATDGGALTVGVKLSNVRKPY